MSLKCDNIEKVIEAYGRGELVIIVDDEDRENEGDLALATEHVTNEALSFMAKKGRGLVCVSIAEETARRLDLPLQVSNNTSLFHTAFTVSFDHRDVADKAFEYDSRCYSMKKVLDSDSKASDFVRPGHIIPLIANPKGTLGRRGQTEGSYDLARLAGCQPSGIICEILNEDGTMAQGSQIQDFAIENNLLITSVEEIIAYRLKNEILVREVARAPYETDYGMFTAIVFQDDTDSKEHIVLQYGSDEEIRQQSTLMRIHSECLTGDIFSSRRCDCGDQLDQAMKSIVKEGAGLLLYLRQEGRGIGLVNKLKAYALQDKGRDTVDANLELGFDADERNFAVAAKILHSLEVANVRLMTNNPKKEDALNSLGIKVEARISIIASADECSKSYLSTKKEKMGHIL